MKDLYFKREDLHPYGSHKGRSITVMIDIYIKEGILSIDLYFSKELKNKPKIINKITTFEIKNNYRINKESNKMYKELITTLKVWKS